MLRAVTLILLCLLLSSCEDSSENRLSKIKREIEEQINSTTESVEELTPSKEDVHKVTTEEFEKLSLFEYSVIELGGSAAENSGPITKEAIEQALIEAGKNRWECFDTVMLDTRVMILCKRRPSSYLRYIPRMFP